MKRALQWLGVAVLSAALLSALLFVLAGVSLRSNRHHATIPVAETPRIFSIRNFLSDVYAARVGGRVIIFDAGMDPDARALQLLVDSLGADLDAVSDIFLTHGHFDHVAAAARCPKARVHIGAPDADLLAHRVSPAGVAPWLFGMVLSVPAVEATHRIVGSELIDVGANESVLAVPLPGHTPGSYAYLFDGVLFTGDALFVEGDQLLLADTKGAMPTNCDGVSIINDLFRKHRINAICTGHRGCSHSYTPQRSVPGSDRPRRLDTLTLAAGPRCSG
jgi:glyoxylase-like metal-dependent hydrolase (beta-lactamase superfamily II)